MLLHACYFIKSKKSNISSSHFNDNFRIHMKSKKKMVRDDFSIIHTFIFRFSTWGDRVDGWWALYTKLLMKKGLRLSHTFFSFVTFLFSSKFDTKKEKTHSHKAGITHKLSLTGNNLQPALSSLSHIDRTLWSRSWQEWRSLFLSRRVSKRQKNSLSQVEVSHNS